MQTVATHLAAVLLGAGIVLAAMSMGARQAGRTSRYLERTDARQRAILEAERARLLNLHLAKNPEHLAALQWSSPAQPPPPDPALAGRPGVDPLAAVLADYHADLNELPDPEMDELDDAALRVARH